METLAIIPARGGSKGIPGKNLRLLAGVPLVAHSIVEARAAETVDRVVVSTDDAETASVSRRFGAEVIERPADISGDSAASESALLHALEYLDSQEGYSPDLVVFLQCTAPLTMAEDIDGTVNALLSEDADSALAVAPFHYFVWKQAEGGGAIGVNHDKSKRQLRQESEPQFLEAGAVYAMRTEGFLEAHHRFFGRTVTYVIPEERALEIDEPFQLDLAAAAMGQRQRKGIVSLLPDAVRAIALDFDGVLTDNRVLVLEDGTEGVMCHRGDGLGIDMVRGLDIPVVVISKERNPVVKARCDKLRIECIQGCDDKPRALREWLDDRGIDPTQTIFVGNDVNDIDCMTMVGCGIAVADAHPDALAAAKIVLSANGGHGAVRELCDAIVVSERSRV